MPWARMQARAMLCWMGQLILSLHMTEHIANPPSVISEVTTTTICFAVVAPNLHVILFHLLYFILISPGLTLPIGPLT